MSRVSAVRGWLEQQLPAMVELLAELAAAESPTLDPQSQQAPLARLGRELERAGLETRAIRAVGVGDHLYARPRRRGAPYQLLLGHVDTVWPHGTLATMPVHRRDGLLYGPGVIDMKGGLVVLAFALRALAELGLEPAVTPVVFVNTDEEIGSPDSGRWLARLARGATRAFVLEGAETRTGRLKIARKGVGRFTVTVHGRAAHAGTSPQEGVSAILELSNQVQRLFALNEPVRGITVNVGRIDGGLRANVVAPEASAVVGVRAPTVEAARGVETAIRSLEPTLPGSRLAVEGGFGRPPMEPSARNRALLGTAIRLGAQLGLHLEEAGLVGGGSDANITSLYTGTLDGLGPRGDGSHAAHENVVVASLPERAALLALLLLEPASAVPASALRRRRGTARRVAVVGSPANETNGTLVASWQNIGLEAELVPVSALRDSDLVLARLDVLPTLDGVEDGLLQLLLLERRGARVLNRAATLVCTHDKLLTARVLERAGLPHPRTVHLRPGREPGLAPPLVVKPRFGSWGADVRLCETPDDLAWCLEEVRQRPWFLRHGALLQELVTPRGHDLRVVVAAGRVVGAAERIAAPGEWRTNVSLGGSLTPANPSADAIALALAAARTVAADLVGVDLLPLDGGYTILELNGAVEFDDLYSLPGRNAYAEAAAALATAWSRPGVDIGRSTA